LTEFTKLTKLNAESRPETATPDQGAFAAKVQERAKSGGGEFDREIREPRERETKAKGRLEGLLVRTGMVLFPGLFSCIWCISWLKSFCLKILAALNHIDTFQCKELKERRGRPRISRMTRIGDGAGPRQKQKLGIRRRSEAMAGQEQKAEIPIKKSNAETLK
jgi:hypothetical protein